MLKSSNSRQGKNGHGPIGMLCSGGIMNNGGDEASLNHYNHDGSVTHDYMMMGTV